VRNFLATLLLSQGVPMLVAGDELGRTQNGNNNAYCQDNETSWLDWQPPASAAELPRFLAELIALRKAHAVLRPSRHTRDIVWLRPDGTEMAVPDWHAGAARALGMLNAEMLVLFNSGEADVAFVLPAGQWDALMDSFVGAFGRIPCAERYSLRARSLAVLVRPTPSAPARKDA
jgi:glycogen operon protein